MLEVQVKRQIDNAINATGTGYLTVTHGHKDPISTFTPIYDRDQSEPTFPVGFFGGRPRKIEDD